MTEIPEVTEIKLLQKSRRLTVAFSDDSSFTFSCEFLRLHSPSADNRHQPATDKADVNIIAVDPVGNYGVKLVFDDGHDTGIYTWKTLYELGQKHER